MHEYAISSSHYPPTQPKDDVMAPVRPSRLNLQASSIMQDRQHHQDLCCSTTTTLASDLEFDSSTLSPRHLYAQSFDRTQSSLSLQLPPTTRIHRKNMKDMTGYLTTEEEFEALPIAVRKKVCCHLDFVIALCLYRRGLFWFWMVFLGSGECVPLCDNMPRQ